MQKSFNKHAIQTMNSSFFNNHNHCNITLLSFNIVRNILKVPPDRRSPSPDQERRYGHRMAPPPAQDRYGRSSRYYNEREMDRFSPQRRRPTRRERLEMDLEQYEDETASDNSYEDEMHRPPPHRYPRDYPPLPPPGNMWEWESGYSIHLPLKRRLEYHSPPPFFFVFFSLFLNSNWARKRCIA